MRLRLCVNVSEVARSNFSPQKVVSEAQYWQTEPVWMDKPTASMEGVLIWQSDNSLPPREWESDSVQFTDGDYVIMLSEAIKVFELHYDSESTVLFLLKLLYSSLLVLMFFS